MEKFFISNGDYSATIVGLWPKTNMKAAQRDFLQWVSSMQMQQIAPSPQPPLHLLKGTYDQGSVIAGSTAMQDTSFSSDGQGGLSYHSETYVSGIGSSYSNDSGSYSIKGNKVFLRFQHKGSYNCVISRRYNDGSIKQINCGGTTWTHN